ncbi:MAG: citrate/2-methylcitrate synthase, partial [Pseudolysinimonas sp.]
MSDSERPDTATFSYGGTTAEFPVRHAVEGRDSVDISTFMRDTGLSTLDQGFVNTASTKSAITYIDGDAGILRYRGYAIEDLA